MDEVLTEEGRPGGTFLIFFACDSVEADRRGNHISQLTQKDLIAQVTIQSKILPAELIHQSAFVTAH